MSHSVELGTSTPTYLLQYAASARLAPSRSIIDSILRMFLFGFVDRMLSALF